MWLIANAWKKAVLADFGRMTNRSALPFSPDARPYYGGGGERGWIEKGKK